MVWKKSPEKQRAKGWFEKKSPKNNARRDGLEKIPRKTMREGVVWKKSPEKQRAKGWLKKSTTKAARCAFSPRIFLAKKQQRAAHPHTIYDARGKPRLIFNAGADFIIFFLLHIAII